MGVWAAVVGHVEALGELGWQAMGVWRLMALRVGRSHDLQVGHSAGWRRFYRAMGEHLRYATQGDVIHCESREITRCSTRREVSIQAQSVGWLRASSHLASLPRSLDA